MSIVGNMHSLVKVVSRKSEGIKRVKWGNPEEKEKEANTPSNSAFEKSM